MTEREKWDRISTRASNLWPVRHLPRFFHRIEILPMRCSSSLPRVRAYSPSGRIAHLNSHATYSHYAWNPNVANNPANMKSCFLTKFKIAPFPSRPPVSLPSLQAFPINTITKERPITSEKPHDPPLQLHPSNSVIFDPCDRSLGKNARNFTGEYTTLKQQQQQHERGNGEKY